MSANNASSDSQPIDNQRWKAFYYRSITDQINALTTLIKNQKRNPATLAKHFDSIIVAIEEALSHPDIQTRSKLIELVRNLHPLPLWWGKWTEWMRIIETITPISKEGDDMRDQFWLYQTQAEMLIIGGDGKKALILAKEALRLAQEYNNPAMIFIAEMAVLKPKKIWAISVTVPMLLQP